MIFDYGGSAEQRVAVEIENLDAHTVLVYRKYYVPLDVAEPFTAANDPREDHQFSLSQVVVRRACRELWGAGPELGLILVGIWGCGMLKPDEEGLSVKTHRSIRWQITVQWKTNVSSARTGDTGTCLSTIVALSSKGNSVLGLVPIRVLRQKPRSIAL
jgi:hypothetical protein